MGVRLSVKGGGVERAVETATEDDFMYFRDSIHAALETGEFGSRFPVFMKRFFESWEGGESEALERELIEIRDGLRKLPANPADGNWSSKLAGSGRQAQTLADVFLDANDANLVDGLVALATLAREKGLAVRWG